jgi:Lytic transglycolase
LGACGDTYNDSSFTAAVPMDMYDSWPGATAEQNRYVPNTFPAIVPRPNNHLSNPICGPFVPGRKIIDSTGSFKTAVPGPEFAVIGGDGLINCATSSRCHKPLTATVRHGSNQITVEIVDRCVGCKSNDIDLTPTAFAALADMALGRTYVEWQFNSY